MNAASSDVPLEPASVGSLYQQHAPVLFAYLRRHTRSWEDAEDLLLEVFLAALENNQLYAVPEANRLLWLQRVAQRKVADHYRRALRRPVIPIEQVETTLLEDEELVPEQIALRREALTDLRLAVEGLPAQYQEVLRLRFVHGLRGQEIGVVLGKQEGAVRVLLSRALKLLRARYPKQ
ncbi:MAG TPA: RNA polymerase sigma factor [Ktedonobacterales bacterium]|nr:RNA polymerase sigma factor [Ktedonobacterales bacterium]